MRSSTLVPLFAAAMVLVATSGVAVAAAAGPLTYCGTVKAYQPSSATGAGSIVVGSRTYVIAAGTPPLAALSPGDRNGNRCVAGELDAAGRFIRLDSAHPYGSVGSSGVTYTICGTVADYRPPQGQDGLLVLHEGGRETIVPAGTQLPLAAGASPGQRCFSGGLNASGDAIIAGVAAVGGPGGSPQPPPRSLPSTSTHAPVDVSFGFVLGACLTVLLTALLVGRTRRAR